jgi:hypothetical protein
MSRRRKEKKEAEWAGQTRVEEGGKREKEASRSVCLAMGEIVLLRMRV